MENVYAGTLYSSGEYLASGVVAIGGGLILDGRTAVDAAI